MKIVQRHIGTSLLLIIALTCNVIAQEKEIIIKTNKLSENIYMLEGMGGNIGLFVGETEVLMIDSQFQKVSEKILSAIKAITDKPVKLLVNTHWHGDHTGGNTNLKKQGAHIISHENVRKRLIKEQLEKESKSTTDNKLPIITFSEDMMLHLNGEDILLSHVHNAHTDGDAHVYFTSSNIIHMGDTYFQGKFPFIDLKSGGSIDGYIASIHKVLLLVNDETIIIPGHRSLSNKKELKTYVGMLETIKDRVLAEIEKGASLEEISENSSITSEYDKEYGGWFISAQKFRETVYKSLKNPIGVE